MCVCGCVFGVCVCVFAVCDCSLSLLPPLFSLSRSPLHVSAESHLQGVHVVHLLGARPDVDGRRSDGCSLGVPYQVAGVAGACQVKQAHVN